MIWLLILFITGIALGPLVWLALKAPGRRSQMSSLQVDIETYKDQLKEVDEDESRGLLTTEAAARVRTEVSRKLIQASKSLELASQERAMLGAKESGTPMLVVMLGAAVLSLTIYAATGAPDLRDRPHASRVNDAIQERAAMVASLDQRVSQLEQNGGNQADWVALARDFLGIREFGSAEFAYLRAIKVGGETAELYASVGGARVLARSGSVDPEAEAYFDKALDLNLGHGLANYFKGVARYQNEDLPAALEHLKRSVEAEEDGEGSRMPWREGARMLLEEVETKLASQGAGETPSAPEK